MNTKNCILKCLAAGSVILSLTMESFGADYTAHEWGTFTSVQGGDGELLSWRPLQTSELPGFVHDWKEPGMNRQLNGLLNGNEPVVFTGPKETMITLQRMETPVIYFYSDKSIKVDVSVKFPKGLITEWYPQATQIGPSHPADTNVASGALQESRAVWNNLKLLPLADQYAGKSRPPQDESGSHYFAARATSASMVSENFTDQTNNVSEVEKFIFYRGVGNFKTPMHVTVDTQSRVVIQNTGSEKLSGLFLISIHTTNNETIGSVTSANSLAGGQSFEWPFFGRVQHSWQSYPLPQFQTNIAARMEAALESEGLFPDEAKAMVNTWKDSWFTEEGERVLYVLPRTWTDETLPLTLDPKPEKLTRVMVGRAEIITPDAEMNLFKTLTKAQNGDADARIQAIAQLKQFGRFAEPALQLANHHSSQTNVMNLGFELLNNTAPSKFE
jgi:hypothetical protein